MDERPEERYAYIDPEKKVEAHIIADMLRIERISDELREFKDVHRESIREIKEDVREDIKDLKEDVNEDFKGLREEMNRRFDRQEKWMMSLAGIFATSLLGFLGTVLLNYMGII